MTFLTHVPVHQELPEGHEPAYYLYSNAKYVGVITKQDLARTSKWQAAIAPSFAVAFEALKKAAEDYEPAEPFAPEPGPVEP